MIGTTATEVWLSAIVIHASIKYQLLQINSTNPGIQLLHVKILNCSNIQDIIAVYCPSRINTTTGDWEEIFDLNLKKALIAGDFNGHHSNWSYKTDTRGNQLFDAMLDKNYVTMNDGSPTRIKLVNGRLQKSSPDISMASTDLALKLSWKVTNENLGSDHLVIKLSTFNSLLAHIDKKINFKKANWKEYTDDLQNIFSEMSLTREPQKSYDQFMDIMNAAANRHILTIKVCHDPIRLQSFKPKPYCNVDISRAVAERRLALATFRGNPTPQNLSILQVKVSTAQKVIRQAKQKSGREFCSSVNATTSSSEMWRKMRWLKGYRLPRTQVDEDTAQNLLHTLTPDYVPPKQPTFSSMNTTLTQDISVHELDRAIKAKDTAPGHDDISFSMLKHLPPVGKQMLATIYNQFLASGIVPYQWRKTKIVPIPIARRK